jgi:hypothetical protein
MCDLGTSMMRWLWPVLGCCAKREKYFIFTFYVVNEKIDVYAEHSTLNRLKAEQIATTFINISYAYYWIGASGSVVVKAQRY